MGLDAALQALADEAVPPNITLVPLPPKCPELNPMENVWQFMRDNWLSNRVFTSYPDILNHCCTAWNRIADQPWRVTPYGWEVVPDMGGWRFQIEQAPPRLRLRSWPPNGAAAAEWLVWWG